VQNKFPQINIIKPSKLHKNIYKMKTISKIKMVGKKPNFEIVAYVLGIVSIVIAISTPVAGLVLGIIGLVYSKKQKTELSKKAKKLNIIGIVLSIILTIVSIIVAIYLSVNRIYNFPAI